MLNSPGLSPHAGLTVSITESVHAINQTSNTLGKAQVLQWLHLILHSVNRKRMTLAPPTLTPKAHVFRAPTGEGPDNM